MMRFSRSLAIYLLIVSGFATPASAQSAADAAMAANIRELLRMTNALAIGQQLVDQAANSIIPQIIALVQKAHNTQLPPTFGDLLKTEMRTEFIAALPELEQRMITVYAKHLTNDDVAALLAFYKTPAGQRVIAALPTITLESSTVGHAWGQAAGERAAMRAIQKARDMGYQIR